jgi:pimeloyl-ACP methyl ester carboxylesterase
VIERRRIGRVRGRCVPRALIVLAVNLETPDVHYARSADISIAYQVVGNGPVDVVLVPYIINLVWAWEHPIFVDFCRRITSFARLILLDKRGTGLSDRPRELPTLETRMDDVRAVMDSVGSERAALLGVSEGGPMSLLFAATYPERVWALVLAGSYARVLWAPDYPCGDREDEYRLYIDRVERHWGRAEHATAAAQRLAPSADEEGHRALATLMRQSATPGSAAAYARMNMEIDVRHVCRRSAFRRSSSTVAVTPRRWSAGRATSPSTSRARGTSSSRAPTTRSSPGIPTRTSRRSSDS